MPSDVTLIDLAPVFIALLAINAIFNLIMIVIIIQEVMKHGATK